MILNKFNYKKINKIFYIIFLSTFSFFINQYYGYVGINPLDNFFSFNAAYDIINGYYPFKDYWTITGPSIAFFQSILFKIFGISWSVYILQASIFNVIITLGTFFIFYKLKLEPHYCFIYAFLLSIISYPSVGTPYVDHQAAYLSIIGIYFFILAIKINSIFYWFFLPTILGIAFLTKQVPSAYFILLIGFLIFIYFIFNFEIKRIIYFLLGIISVIFLFFILLFIAKIPFLSFLQQYILYPLSIGESRMEFLFPLEFKRIVLRHKLIYLSLLVILFINIKGIIHSYKYFKTDEFLITLSLIISALILITHQLMTMNGLFIFFIIPILAGFSHIYYKEYFKNKKYILYLLIFLSIGSTIHYWNKYIVQRDFLDLKDVNIEKAIDAKVLSDKLRGLKWITIQYKEDPQNEITKLEEVINIIKKDKRNKTLVTDYQFISVILSMYDYSPNAYWFKYHVYPEKGHKYFKIYKDFFINRLKENKIEIVYTIKPLWGDNDVLKNVLNDNCFKKNKINDILDSHTLLNCDQLKN